jgi:predicted transcriptional regulator
LNQERLSAEEKLLLTMHNLCLVRSASAQTASDIANVSELRLEIVQKILSNHEAAGYVKTASNQDSKKYYLTGLGILKVCSSFT